MQKIWLGVIVIMIGLGVYSLYGYLRLETPPIEEEEEEKIKKSLSPLSVVYTPGVTSNEIIIGSS